MRALLVTSEVTFVPGNYDDLVCGIAPCPQIAGLLILRNARLSLFLKGLALMAGGAPRLGKALVVNFFGSSKKRLAVYKSLQKPVWFLDTINGEEASSLIRENKFDLVVNARTRYIYKRPILELPPLGCINIHHGLLPEQRGVMCDFWSLHEKQPAGFTIHKMNQKIDDGKILKKVVVSSGEERDMMHYLQNAARIECQTLQHLLAAIEADGMPEGEPNVASGEIKMRKTPTLKEFRLIRQKGLLL